ncbi:MAG: hypothetical protein J5662_06700 [Clostridia bacterium]|nr:hypothetical protein [Clostridia bacterium]
MENDKLTTMSNEEMRAVFTERSLYAALMEPGAPVYIVDDYETIGKLEAEHIYNIDDFGKALTAQKSHFLQPITGAQTPIIFLTKKNTQKINDAFNILNNAGITVLRQDANKPFDTITSTNVNDIKRELVEQYQKNNSVGGTIAEFINIRKSNANTPPIKTGFNIFDKVLDGGLYEGLYAIGAISSLGKTTFCLNIAEQIAAKQNDVIIIALEMSKYSLVGKSISRQTFIKYKENPEKYDYSLCKTSRGITDGSRYDYYSDNEEKFIEQCENDYAEKIGNHLFIYETVGGFTVKDIKRIVTTHMIYTGNRPVVIVDYLQLIQNEDKFINANDKIRIDFNLTELKRLSRDYKLPIIAISSFNRAGYSTEVKLECFKESGGIDYTCDVIMGLQPAGVGVPNFDVNEAKAKNPREIELVILKNRDAAVGDLIKYYYYPMFNHFEESPENVRAQREYETEQAKAAKELEKKNKAEQIKAEHAELVRMSFDACMKNGSALITDMVDYLGGKPVYKTLERYIRETGKYAIIGNKVIRN